MTTLETLRALETRGAPSRQPPVSGEVLKRIRDGVSRSKTIRPKFIDILLEQEAIE